VSSGFDAPMMDIRESTCFGLWACMDLVACAVLAWPGLARPLVAAAGGSLAVSSPGVRNTWPRNGKRLWTLARSSAMLGFVAGQELPVPAAYGCIASP
jgi:hypothetical protein